MTIPVYLFTGFIDSGKSTFIQDTLRDPQFDDDTTSLLILCEDGEVEYDEVVLASYHCDIVRVENEEDLTFEFLCECHQKYHPEHVFIEFNGMWNVSAFLAVEYPMDWLLVQVLSTVDASSFTMYMNNMRSILYDQLLHSELIVCNRCDDTTKKSFLRGNIKAINKVAQIIYEDVDGQVNNLQEDELPFDISQDSLVIEPDDYGLWYMDALDNPKKYVGKTVCFNGKVVEVDHMSGAMFLIGRDAMVCCEEDISAIGFVVHYHKSEDLSKGQWIRLTATSQVEFDDHIGRDVPVLYAISFEECKEVEGFVSFS